MNTQDYNSCVKDYSDGIFRFILKNLRDSYEAENIVQNTFEKLWIKKDKVEMKTAKAYLYKVAYNNMIDIIRKRKDTVDITEAYDLGTTGNEYTGIKEWLDKAVARLNENQRTVLTLRDYEGYDYASIGSITGMSESQVKVNIFRARKSIKEYLIAMRVEL